MLTVIILSIVIFALGMVCLSIGMIVRGKALRGSCRGPKPVGPDGEVLTCHDCTCQEQQSIPPESIPFRQN